MKVSDTALAGFGTPILEMDLPANLSYKAPLIYRMVNELVNHQCIPPDGRERAELCFDEAVTNAMVHGNRLNPEKRIHVSLFADDARWGFLLRDEGEGFDPRTLPDPESEESLYRESGRGILLMQDYLEELTYGPRGNEVLMVRRRRTESEGPRVAEAAPPPEILFPALGPDIEATEVGICRVWEEEGVQILEVLDSKLSDENLAGLKQGFDHALGRGHDVVVDLAAVKYLSSVVIGQFVSHLKRAKQAGGGIALCRVQPGVLDGLRVARMDRIFPITSQRSEAAHAVRMGTRRLAPGTGSGPADAH